jgi:hypothetical protein
MSSHRAGGAGKISILEGRDRAGAAGHTNSTMDVYATNGVIRQGKVLFLFPPPEMSM